MKKFPLYTELLAKTDRVRSKIGTFPMLVHKFTTSGEYFFWVSLYQKKARITSSLIMQLNGKKIRVGRVINDRVVGAKCTKKKTWMTRNAQHLHQQL